MKKLLLTSFAAVVVLAGCTKSGPRYFEGDYGYAVSGSIACDAVTDENPATTVTLSLTDEQGIMHVISHEGDMVMTTKSLGGSVTVWNIEVNGTDVTVKPFKRRVTVAVPRQGITSGVGDVLKTIDVNCSGSGYKSGRVIVLNLSYSGEPFEVEDLDGVTEYTIKSSDVRLVASEQ